MNYTVMDVETGNNVSPVSAVDENLLGDGMLFQIIPEPTDYDDDSISTHGADIVPSSSDSSTNSSSDINNSSSGTIETDTTTISEYNQSIDEDLELISDVDEKDFDVVMDTDFGLGGGQGFCLADEVILVELNKSHDICFGQGHLIGQFASALEPFFHAHDVHGKRTIIDDAVFFTGSPKRIINC